MQHCSCRSEGITDQLRISVKKSGGVPMEYNLEDHNECKFTISVFICKEAGLTRG